MSTPRTGHALLYVEEPSTYGDVPGYLVVCSCGWSCREQPCSDPGDTICCWTEHVEQALAK